MDPKVTFAQVDDEKIGDDIGSFRAHIDTEDGAKYTGIGSSYAEALMYATHLWVTREGVDTTALASLMSQSETTISPAPSLGMGSGL